MSGLLSEVRDSKRLPPPAMARAIRLAAGVSQARFATEIGVHRVTVARWEEGTRRPRGQHLRAYIQLLTELSKVSAA